MKNNDPKIIVDPIVYAKKPARYKAVAEPAGDGPVLSAVEGDAYRELRVGFFDEKGKCVADAYFTVDSDTGKPRILITTDGDGDGDPAIEVFPLRSGEAVVKYY